jgi:hypothetical protein
LFAGYARAIAYSAAPNAVPDTAPFPLGHLAALSGSNGPADYRVAKKSSAKINEDVLNLSEFRGDDLVVAMKWFCSLGVVVVREIDFDIEHACTRLTPVFTDSVLGFETIRLIKPS